MKKKISPQKKSGFQEGRSKVGPSRSTLNTSGKQIDDGKKTADKKQRSVVKKLEQARNDLAETLKEMDIGDYAFEGETIDESGQPVSRFASDFGIVRRSILSDGQDFNAEAAHRMILKTELAMFLELQPIAEVSARTSKKEQAFYAAIAVAEQIKSLSSELRMLGNIEHQSEFISTSIIEPIFKALLQNLMSQFFNLKNKVDTEFGGYRKLDDSTKQLKREIDQVLTSIGTFLDSSSAMMSSNIHAYMSGDVSFSSSGDTGQASLGKKKRGKRNREL